MNTSKNTKYILVGTYKTNDEKFGWYIDDNKYDRLWAKLNEKFIVLDRKKNSFDRIFGNIEGVNNFHFYDLVKYDNEILTTKDKEVFKIQEKRMECIERLRTLINIIEENPNQEYRIGLQGNNSVGLFLNFLEDRDRLNRLSLSTISKDHRHKKFGEILINKPNLQNLKAFKIFNLTQPAPSHKDLASIFHESWNEFLEINT